MPDPRTISEYVEAVTRETSTGLAESISSTNNPVYRVDAKSGQSYVLKCVKDTGLDIHFGLEVNRRLQQHVPTQEIICTDTSRSAFPFDVILSRYYRGIDVASMVETGHMTGDMEERFMALLLRIFKALESMDMPKPGYGIYKNDRGMHPTWLSFVTDYIERYVGRLENLDAAGPWSTWKQYLLNELADLINRDARMAFKPVSLDTNLKNFLYLPDSGEFMVLNVPLVAVTDQRHGIAEMASQFHGPAHELFLERVSAQCNELLDDQRAFVFYKALAIIGVLAYIATHAPQTIRTSCRWGYPVPCFDTVEDCIVRLAP